MEENTVDIRLDTGVNDYWLTSNNDMTLTENWQSQSLYLLLLSQRKQILEYIDTQDGLALEELLFTDIFTLGVDPNDVLVEVDNHELKISIRDESFYIGE